MKTTKRTVKLIAVLLSVMAMLMLATLLTSAEEATAADPATVAETAQENKGAEILKGLFSGTSLALLGAALAVALPCIGSARGVGMVGEAASGLLSENPSLFGKALILQALPMTQGVYGMVSAFLILFRIGLFTNTAYMTSMDFTAGAYYLMASLPIAVAGLYSAIRQARVSAAGVALLAKRPGESGKAVTSAALVETYAILALLISMLLILLSPFAA